MDEVVQAVGVLTKPFRVVRKVLIVEPILEVLLFMIDFFCRYILDSKLGHIFIRTVFSPMFSWTLSRIYDCREAYQIFNGMPNGAREVIVGFSSLLNIRILNEPARKIISIPIRLRICTLKRPSSSEEVYDRKKSSIWKRDAWFLWWKVVFYQDQSDVWNGGWKRYKRRCLLMKKDEAKRALEEQRQKDNKKRKGWRIKKLESRKASVRVRNKSLKR